MTPEEYEIIMGNSQLLHQQNVTNQSQMQQQMFQEQERGLAEEQLDVEEIIDRIYNLLQGKEFRDTGGGIKGWIENPDNQMRILSEWGVQRIMQVVRFHINKNTLLSNFREEQINNIMYHFTTELNDLVLLKYNTLFREITFEECKKKIQDRIKDKENLKHFNFELLGQNVDRTKIKQDILNEMEGRIEKEMEKVKQDALKDRIKEYGLLLWEIEQSVYSTFNRALGGKERETLRRHAQFTEVRALQPEGLKTKGGMFGWLKG